MTPEFRKHNCLAYLFLSSPALAQDLLKLLRKVRGSRETGPAAAAQPHHLLALDGSLRSLLQAWFSAGFLELRRITYEGSGGALLEKIAR